MLVAEEFVGRLDDEEIAARVDGSETLTVTVDDTERRRSRFRTTAEDGTEVGVVVARELRDGDVLDADGTLVVVSLTRIEAMVIDFDGVSDVDAVTTALELGHAVGNRHWDLAVEGERAYLPAAESRERMASTVEPHLPPGATVGYEDVPPTLFDDGDAADHSHGHGDGHTHSHGKDGHTHDDGTSHSHGDGVRTLDPDAGGEES